MSLKKFSEHSNTDEKTQPTKVTKMKTFEAPIKEDVLVNKNLNVEILEEKIIKFNDCDIKDIYETIKSKYADIDYFLRKKGTDIHIVKYNEKLKLDVNQFVDSLFKFYSTNEKLTKLVHGIKIKGNANFSVIEKLNPIYADRVLEDLTKLLSKKEMV